MITRSQSQNSRNENECPNYSINSNSNSTKSPHKLPLKQQLPPSAQKKQEWPSVKQLRAHYETLPDNNNKSLEGGVLDRETRQRRSSYGGGGSSSSSRSTYQQRVSLGRRLSNSHSDRRRHYIAVDGNSDHETRSKLRHLNDDIETTLPTPSTLSAAFIDDESKQHRKHNDEAAAAAAASFTESLNGCREKEVAAAAAVTKTNGRRMKESVEELLESTLIEPEKETAPFLPSPIYSEDNVRDEDVDFIMPKNLVSKLEGRRLNSNLTTADEGMVDDDDDDDDGEILEKNDKRCHCIQLQEPTVETMTNLCPTNNCKKKEIKLTKSNVKEAVTLAKLECSTTSLDGATVILICLSQLILLGLTLFEMHCRYMQTLASTSSQGATEDVDSSSWQQMMNVGFVFALVVKATYKSAEAAREKETWMQKAACFMRHLMFWAVTIPLFHKCSASTDNVCFLPTKLASHQGLASSGACIPSYSLFDVAVTNRYRAVLSQLKSMIKGKLLSQVWKEIQRALSNPFKFHARVQKGLVILKWAKYLGPLIGTFNKFRGNLLDMAKKRRQHRVSKAALKRWYDVIDALSKQSKSEQAVVQLQKAFRERRVEKTKKRQLLMANRRWVRNKLEEEERLTRTKLEQIELRNIVREQRRQVSLEERRGITLHRESARKLMKRLLFNPKNYFSVIWKYVAVSSVALEIMTILFAPVLSGDVKKMPLDQFIVKVLLGSRPQCNKAAKIVATSLLIPSIGSISDITCSASKVKQIWFVAAHVIATILVPVVNCVCFLDVFITFFTGELSNNGTLEPKPFFQRWVLPGPVLQIFVNPTMASIKMAMWNAVGASIKIGPGLCLHCLLTCGVFAVYLYDRLFDTILDFVVKINEFNAQTKGQDDDDALHWT